MAAVECALQLAPDAAITFVHAYDGEFEGVLWRGDVPQSTIDAFRRNARTTALARIHHIADRVALPESRFKSVVTRGYAPRIILDAALRNSADLIAMGKQGRSLLGRLFIGSVTRHVLYESSCDVLVARGPRS
jgi:nucleotide-binding universal stress UspA family protein